MPADALTTAPAGRVRLSNLHVLIDGRTHQIVNMSIVDVLVAGAPDWIAPRQKIEFSFVLTLDGKERAQRTADGRECCPIQAADPAAGIAGGLAEVIFFFMKNDGLAGDVVLACGKT